MNHTNIRYVPIEKNNAQKSLLFQVQLAPKHDGNWIAWIGALPGCAAWGATKDEALMMLTQTARAYVQMLRDKGMQMPDSVETVNMPVVAVTL
jgi:predicted RNase H-like HicB family nuclease